MIIVDRAFGENWRIKVEEYSYTVQRRNVNRETGEITWHSQSYPSTLGGAVQIIAKRILISQEEFVTLQQYVARMESALAGILTRLKF